MLIIFSGYNQRAVVAFVRALEKNKIKKYKIIASGEEDPILKTSYQDKVYYVRNSKELNKQEIYPLLRTIVKETENGKAIIVPSTEGLNRFLVENKKEIEDLGVTIPLVENELYSIISDKRTFWELCKENKLVVPRMVHISSEYEFKYVAKPIKYISNSGQRLIPIIVDSKEKHKDFIDNFDQSDFDIQEYVDGESIYLLYYFSKNGNNLSFSQRNLVQQPQGKSMVVSISWDTHHQKISENYISLFRKIGFFGFAMVELRKKGEMYYMIEANPRMWGPSQLYVDSGVPFIEAFLADYGEIRDIPNQTCKEPTAYFWSGGIRKTLMEDSDCIWLEGGKELVENNYELIMEADIYKRPDTIAIFDNERVLWEEC